MRWRGLVRRWPWLLAGLFAGYWVLMFLATHLPMPDVPSAPSHTDKLVHLVMYAGFAFLLCLWRSSRGEVTGRLRWTVFGIAAGYAILDELLQIPLESRSGDFWDFVMDCLGAGMGLLAFGLAQRWMPGLWEPDR